MVYKKVIKYGNSLAIIVPAEWLRQMNIIRGDYVCIAMTETGMLVMRRAPDKMVEHLKQSIDENHDAI